MRFQYNTVPWNNPSSQPALSCTGSSWDGTLVHGVPSSQHCGFLLPKSPAGFSRLCRGFPDGMAPHPYTFGIFCLIQGFRIICYILSASWAACSGFLISGPEPAVPPRTEKANGSLPTISPEGLTGGTC